MKKILSIIAQATTATVLLLLVPPISTTAIFNGGGGMDIAQRLEVCKLVTCTESDWYNYSGDLTSGGQTLTMRPGETLKLRVKSWAPTNEVTNVDFMLYMGSAVNYLEAVPGTLPDMNSDGDAISYTPFVGGTLSISTLPAGGTQSTAQAAILPGMKIKSDAPDQALIRIDLGLAQLTRGQSSVAYAQFLNESEIRVLVSNPSAPRAVQTLPKTGADADTNNQSYK